MLFGILIWAGVLYATSPPANPIQVRQMEGQLHGFLVLRTEDGAVIAEGDLAQSTRGRQVTSRLTYHFKDGSLHDETSVFSQTGHFSLLSYHLVQKGPAFKRPLMDLTINRSTGMVEVKYKDHDGKDKSTTSHLELPPDLANGMVPIILKNMAGAQSTTVSMLVATPKPMLVKLAISSADEDSFSTAGVGHKAIRYVVKVEIGGIKGVLAPVVGKQPPDTLVWILAGSSPAFVKSEGPLFEDGPIWRTELTSPVWPKQTADSADRKK